MHNIDNELYELRLKNRISHIFLTVADEKMYEEVLTLLLETFKSEFGIFGYFNQSREFVVPAVSRKNFWSKCMVKNKDIFFQRSLFGKIWKKTVYEKKPVFSNSGPFHLPKGHMQIRNTILAPIVYRDEVISVIKLANSKNGYSNQDLNSLKAIADHIAPVLAARLERDNRTLFSNTLINTLPCVSMMLNSSTGKIIAANRIALSMGAKINQTVQNCTWHPHPPSQWHHPPPVDIKTKHQNLTSEQDGKIWDTHWLIVDKSTYLLYAFDITDRKQQEAKLVEREKYYRLLVEPNPYGIQRIDTEGTILFANAAHHEMYDHAEGELIGKNVIDFSATEEEREKTAAYIKRLVQEQPEPTVYRHQVITKNGTQKTIEVCWNYIKNSYSEVIGFLSVLTDITSKLQAQREHKNLEIQLRHLHKMEAIGTLAGGIAHDFNNILTAIIGYADIARDNIPAWSPAKYHIEEVLKAGNRAKELVKQIIHFSRMDARELAPVQLHLVVREALKLLRASIPTSIDIIQDIDPACGNVLADPTQIHQVLINLCTNAAQAMEETGGILQVTLKAVYLDENDFINNKNFKPGHYALLSVTDNGIGMDQDILERIFDPYFTTKEVGKGSGIGLSVVHGITQTHSGLITVESKVGIGTTFNVFFPRIEGDITAKVSDNGPLPRGKERILLIDDEKNVLDLMKIRLERLGYKVTAKVNSKEAFKLFSSQSDQFDLVITDQAMPGLTGKELAKKFIEIKPEIPIILCTGYSTTINAEIAKEIGIAAFALKPISKKQLAKTIRSLLDHTSQDKQPVDTLEERK